MTNGMIAAASVEHLNERREQMVQCYGIKGASKRKEWKAIEREVSARKAYTSAESVAFQYSQYLTLYQPSASASDGQ